ncbi:MAG: hypothetical protein ACTSSQ_07685, partial [Alphaproteobacteria bacterium]
DGAGAVSRLWTRTTLLYRTEAANAIGSFVDLPGRLGETIDWLARGRDLGHNHVMVEEILALRRVRPGSLTHNRDAAQNRGYIVAVKRALDRKREMAAETNAS